MARCLPQSYHAAPPPPPPLALRPPHHLHRWIGLISSASSKYLSAGDGLENATFRPPLLPPLPLPPSSLVGRAARCLFCFVPLSLTCLAASSCSFAFFLARASSLSSCARSSASRLVLYRLPHPPCGFQLFSGQGS